MKMRYLSFLFAFLIVGCHSVKISESGPRIHVAQPVVAEYDGKKVLLPAGDYKMVGESNAGLFFEASALLMLEPGVSWSTFKFSEPPYPRIYPKWEDLGKIPTPPKGMFCRFSLPPGKYNGLPGSEWKVSKMTLKEFRKIIGHEDNVDGLRCTIITDNIEVLENTPGGDMKIYGIPEGRYHTLTSDELRRMLLGFDKVKGYCRYEVVEPSPEKVRSQRGGIILPQCNLSACEEMQFYLNAYGTGTNLVPFRSFSIKNWQDIPIQKQ